MGSYLQNDLSMSQEPKPPFSLDGTEDRRHLKQVYDNVHGNIKLDALSLKFIDTVQFQRLRDLKQLGLACMVYPGAVHSRFEHSLGVYWLAGQTVRCLQTDQTELDIDRFDIQTVKLAGLMHDDKVEIRQGSWFDPLQDVKGRLTGLISNPPYIPSSHISGLQAEVGRHEPRLALDGGENGMEHLVHLCEGSASALKAGGFFAFETNGDEQTEFIADLMKTKWGDFFCNIKRVPDFAGIKRFLTGYRR